MQGREPQVPTKSGIRAVVSHKSCPDRCVRRSEGDLEMRTRTATALALATMLAAGVARAQDQEGTRISPVLEQLRESVSDRLHSAADQLALTAEQREKIREV